MTDTEQETKGLLQADRTPQLDVAAIREITQRLSTAIPGEVLLNIHVVAVAVMQGGTR